MTAATGTVLIGIGAFWLSFMSLADLATRSGIAMEQAWIWPLLVDGQIVVSTIAVVALDERAGVWYPWALLMGGALMSVTANALHAVVAADASVPAVLAAAVAAVPPLVLLASTHLTVVLTRSTQPTNPASEVDADDAREDADELLDPLAAQETITPVEEQPHEVGRREQAKRLRKRSGRTKRSPASWACTPQPWAAGSHRPPMNHTPATGMRRRRTHHEYRSPQRLRHGATAVAT
ncbi:hypothetical protein GCM10023171_23950 [Microbacterium panaciterrae]|uniref:DUF2637 domain-containing protein n=1 Tax=Microbacterium panaciterrae TaxID=985759 RepID=A0ABP8PJ91_9MICO